MTSPSIPVRTSRSPVLGIMVTSTNNTSPPGRRPGQTRRDTRAGNPSATSSKNRGWPRYATTLSAVIGTDSLCPSANRRATFRATAAISHRRLHAGLAGVPPHDLADGFRLEGEPDRWRGHARPALSGSDIVWRSQFLLLVRVPRQHQDLHAVTQARGWASSVLAVAMNSTCDRSKDTAK